VALVLEASSDEAVTTPVMKVGSLGNLKSKTLRAFNESEVDQLLAKV
jgi:uncharacterized protein with GYD domain